MGQELKGPHSQQQKEKRHHHHTVMALVGLFLVILGLGSLGVSIYVRNTPTATLTRVVSSFISSSGSGSGGPCFSVSPGDLAFTTLQGQSDPAVQTVTLHPNCPQTESWSATIATNQGAHWLSISPTRGDLSKTQAVSIIMSSSLNEGMYTGYVTFFQNPEAAGVQDIKVIARVVQDQASLKDLVAFTHIHDLTIVAEWPAQLVKDQSANITISLLSSRSLPHNLPSAVKSTDEQYPLVLGSSSQWGPLGDSEDWLLADGDGFNYQLISLVAQLEGTAFDISSPVSHPQTPYQSIVSFRWNILPKEAGPQNLAVGIAGQWQPQEGGREPVMSTFLDGGFAVNVDESPQPPFTIGQIRLSDLLGLLVPIGTAIGVPWINNHIKKRKEAKKKEEEKQHPTAGSPKSTPPQPTKKPRGRKYRGSRRRN